MSATATASKPASTPAAAKPAATFDVGATKVTVWFPKATLADGTVVGCSHTRYGHETLKAAQACIRSVIAQAGHTVA